MPWSYWLLAAALPIIPDLDVFSTASYGSSLLGHRGITHTLAFALASLGAVAAAATFRHFKVRWWSLACLFFVIVASHGLLDAMTPRGENIPVLLAIWPALRELRGADSCLGHCLRVSRPEIQPRRAGRIALGVAADGRRRRDDDGLSPLETRQCVEPLQQPEPALPTTRHGTRTVCHFCLAQAMLTVARNVAIPARRFSRSADRS